VILVGDIEAPDQAGVSHNICIFTGSVYVKASYDESPSELNLKGHKPS
jgi:hypothetical protein